MGRNARIEQYSEEENIFWGRFISCAGETFYTLKGLAYSFAVHGNEIFFDRKEKSVTRATVIAAYRQAKFLLETHGSIDGPKQLGVFGASYLFPVFNKLESLISPDRNTALLLL